MIYLANAFSLNMLPTSSSAERFFTVAMLELTEKAAAKIITNSAITSAIGHQDTATVLSNLLGMHIPMNRTSVVLGPQDTLIVAQYNGSRLQEGATTIPEGASFTFWMIKYANQS